MAGHSEEAGVDGVAVDDGIPVEGGVEVHGAAGPAVAEGGPAIGQDDISGSVRGVPGAQPRRPHAVPPDRATGNPPSRGAIAVGVVTVGPDQELEPLPLEGEARVEQMGVGKAAFRLPQRLGRDGQLHHDAAPPRPGFLKQVGSGGRLGQDGVVDHHLGDSGEGRWDGRPGAHHQSPPQSVGGRKTHPGIMPDGCDSYVPGIPSRKRSRAMVNSWGPSRFEM